MTLNPVLRIGEQMAEAILTHENVPRPGHGALPRGAGDGGHSVARKAPAQLPHEFSGGMRQRVAIAIAMLNKPDLIICDEPTTALDVTIQGQILYRMQEICRQHDTALIWITHDLGVVAELADRVAVMYAGRIVESGPVDAVLDAPRHPIRAACSNRCRRRRSLARACARSTAWRRHCRRAHRAAPSVRAAPMP